MNRRRLVSLVALLLLPMSAWAAPPNTSVIEGLMTSAGGGAAADGTYDVTFSVYEASSGGNAVWSEGPVKVAVKGGQFSYALGTTKTIDIAKLGALKAQWLGVKIGADPELARVKLHATLFALHAGAADKLTCTGCITAGQVANGALSAAKMGFNYAGSATKGGPASDLACTGCVTVAELKFDKDVDLGKQSLKATNITAAGTVMAQEFVGDGSKLTGLKTPAGECTTAGEVVKGINADGSLKCVKAMDPTALPKDGIDEISNGLIANQFVDEIPATATGNKVLIPDNQGVDAVWNLTFPNIGTAQEIDINVKVENTDLATIAIYLLPPDDKKTGWVLCDPCGKKDEKKYDATFNPKNPPQEQKGAGKKIADWVGANPQGLWTLKVKDTSFCVPQAPGNSAYCNTSTKKDGWISYFSVKLKTLSNQKIAQNGDVYISGKLWGKDQGHGKVSSPLQLGTSVKLGDDKAVCDQSRYGAMRYANDLVSVCTPGGWVPISFPVAFPGSKLITPKDGVTINGWIGAPFKKWKLCYQRSKDGTSSSTFHSKCNYKGPTVTVIKNNHNKIFGGYAACPWVPYYNAYSYGCGGTFLFSLTNGHRYSHKNYHNGSSNSFSYNDRIYNHSGYGPCFGGGHDLCINSSNMTGGYCNLGHDYTCRVVQSSSNGYSGYGTSQCRNDFCGAYNWSATEIEVWMQSDL